MLLLIAVILIIGGIFILRTNIKIDMYREVPKSAGVLAIVLGIVAITGACVRVIPAGHVGVQVLFGKVSETSLSSGLKLVNPLVTIEEMSVRTMAYTMSSVADEGQVRGDDSIKVLASDGLQITLEITLWFRLDPLEAARIFRDIGPDYEGKIVRPAIRTALRNAAARHQATDIYSTKREAFVADVEVELAPVFKEYGVIYERTNLRNIALPQKLSAAIEEKLSADQEQQRMQYIIKKESQEAERKRIEAKGISDANEIISDSLTQPYLQWYHIEMMRSLAESPNTTFIFSPFDDSLIPFLNVGK